MSNVRDGHDDCFTVEASQINVQFEGAAVGSPSYPS